MLKHVRTHTHVQVPTEDHKQRLLKEYTLYLERLLSDEKYEKMQREVEERRVLQRQEALREQQREMEQEEKKRKAEENARMEKLRVAAEQKKEREERLRRDQAKSEKLKREREQRKKQKAVEEENRARIERIKAQKKEKEEQEEEQIRRERMKKKEEESAAAAAAKVKEGEDEEEEETNNISNDVKTDGVLFMGGTFCVSIPHWMEEERKEIYKVECNWYGGKTYKSASWSTHASYSQLKKIHVQLLERVEILKLRVGENVELPKFPSDSIAMATGKHIKRIKGSGLIEQRRSELESYLKGILKIKGILGWKPIESFLDLTSQVRKAKQKALREARKLRENQKKNSKDVPEIPKTATENKRVVLRTASQEKSFEEDPLAFLVGNS